MGGVVPEFVEEGVKVEGCAGGGAEGVAVRLRAWWVVRVASGLMAVVDVAAEGGGHAASGAVFGFAVVAGGLTGC